MVLWNISPGFPGLFSSKGKITHVLLTRLPLSRALNIAIKETGPFDLHVLGMPPAFTLSQDQTLHKYTRWPPDNRENKFSLLPSSHRYRGLLMALNYS